MELPRMGRKLRYWRRLRSGLDWLRRATHLGNYWSWDEAPELGAGVEISSLICPLRYDVIVRRDFFAFYTERRELFRHDEAAFLALARQSSYHTWFTTSEVIRSRAHLLGDFAAIEAAFVERVRRSATLYESVAARDFDSRAPIILKTAARLLPPTTDRRGPPTGKLVSERYFLADGCHRLALLMFLGHTMLPAGSFRVKRFKTFSPFDSTSLLARSLPIEPGAYFAFLSSRYCAPQIFEDGCELLEYILLERPTYLEEVLSLIQVDGFDRYIDWSVDG
jgi:hypothetical protein